MKCDIDSIKKRGRKAFVEVGAFNKDKKIIGAAELSKLRTDKKFIWLHELEVHPSCRRKGIGTALIDTVSAIGKESGAELIYVYPATPIESTGKELTPAQLEAFYKSQGFKQCNAPQDVATVTDEGLFKRGMCLNLKEENKNG